MVSLTAILATSTAFFASTSAALKVGDYFRPSPDVTTGFHDKTAPYRRSPCPGLNTLANHGYINRNGLSLTKAELHAKIMEHYNVNVDIADILTAPLPDVLDLNLLGKHHFIEHDGSIVHADAYFGADPSHVDEKLFADVIRRIDPKKNVIDVPIMGAIRRDRVAACFANNPECQFGDAEVGAALPAASIIIKVFGNATSDTITRERFTSVLHNERLPEGFVRPPFLTLEILGALGAKIAAAESGSPTTTTTNPPYQH